MKLRNDNLIITIILVILIVIFFTKFCNQKTIPPANKKEEKKLTIDNENLLLGNPTNATHNISTPDNYLIDHKYYIESYNSSRNIPNWVSWHVDASDLGNADRMNDFRADNNLPGSWYTVNPNSYKSSGFDKGHNCPSADRTATQEANSSTFLMDNIIPQAPRNNEQTWEHLESYCRDKVKKGSEVYIVMGSYGIGGTGSKGYQTTIGYGKIVVPAHIWKVVVILPQGNNDLARINNQTRVIAVDTPNDNSIKSNWMNYVTTVSEIEKACSCNLLSALPQTLQNSLENERFKGGN